MKHTKQNIVRVLALILAVLIALGVLVSAAIAFAEPEQKEKNSYTMDMYLHEERQALEVSQKLSYVNRTGKTLEYVMFNLYPNVLRRTSTLPFEEQSQNDAFPDGYVPGGVEFVQLTVNGEPADWGVQGDSEQFLRVSCHLSPGERVEFGFDYYVMLVMCNGLTGVGDLDWRLTNFYPIAAVYDSSLQDFSLEAYTKIGECFYSDVSDYEVTLNAPEAYLAASTGVRTYQQLDDGRILWRIQANDMRDLAIVLGRRYSEYTRTVSSGAVIRVLANDASAARRILDAAVGCMEQFGAWFGAYPYESLDIVQSNYFLGGISFPGLILIDEKQFPFSNRKQLAKTVITQVAHQWFSGLVGSNSSREPWLDEALSGYAALLYTEEQEGHEAYLDALNEQVLASLQLTLPGGVTVDSGISRFDSRAEYEIIVLDRGIAVLHELRNAMGERVFLDALKRYVQDMWLKNASIADFSRSLNEASGGRWDEYLVGQMYEIENYANQQLERIE